MQTEVIHADDMTVRNFYQHMGMRHPIEGVSLEKLHCKVRGGNAYDSLLAFHERVHSLEVGEQFDHIHNESELT